MILSTIEYGCRAIDHQENRMETEGLALPEWEAGAATQTFTLVFEP